MTNRVLLLPGFGCDGDSMFELKEALEESNNDYTPEVVDFSGEITLDGMVDRVKTSIGPDSATIIGLSMGSWVAQAVAARAPDQVRSIVLIASWSRAPESYIEIVRQLHDEIAAGKTLASLRDGVASGFADPDRAEELADRWLSMAERVGVETFLTETTAILAHPHVDEDARKITAPTLVLAGAQDRLIPSESQDANARYVPGSKFIMIDKSGHNLTWEQPEATNEAILAWLDEQLA